jgi:hypothetical protein
MTEEILSFRELSMDDAPKIAAAISELTKFGLKPLFPESEFLELARQKAEEFEGLGIPEPPLPSTWADFALNGSVQVFANAIHYQDDRFDQAGEGAYAEVVASIMALAEEDWSSATITATRVVKAGRYGPSKRMEIAIDGPGRASRFDLIEDTSFDWSVVTRLNERLPSGATGRFAAFFDGQATIVYLKPDQLDELSRLFGYSFISEIEPLQERPQRRPAPSRLEAAIQRPLPIWRLVIGLPMGIFTAGRLLQMILGGAPFTIGSHGARPISLGNVPLEFIFEVTAYIVCTVLFLGLPLYLMVMRWRVLTRAGEYDPHRRAGGL